MTHRIARTATLSALGAAAALTLASCSTAPAEEETAPAPEATSEQAPAETTGGAGDGAENAGGASDGTAGSTGGASDGSPSPSPQQDGAWLETITAVIERAESETGGTAFEIDDQDDDGSWEVQVAAGDEEWEVDVSADGAEVLSSERDDDVDGEDRAALDAAGITLVDAIRAAEGENPGGAFDDATLEDDDDHGAFTWEVSFEDDVDVHVAVTDGAILHVDR